MQTVLLVALSIFIGLLLTAVLIFRRLVSKERLAGSDLAGLVEFSASKYRPMMRLLSEAEFEYLASQPGYTDEIGRRFRADRRRIFRGYLRAIRRDFSRLYLAAKLVVIYSQTDRPDLATALLRRRVEFSYALMTVEMRLTLHRFGLATVDVSGLVEAIERMQTEVRQLVSPAMPLAQLG